MNSGKIKRLIIVNIIHYSWHFVFNVYQAFFMCTISFYNCTCRNSFEAEEEPLRQALMYYTMSVYGCFQSAHFPSIIIGQYWWYVSQHHPPSPGQFIRCILIEVRPLNLRLCKYFLHLYRYYIPGKSVNVTTTKRPRFHPSDPCACSS